MSDEGILHFKGRLCVPNNEELRKQILSKAHDTPYSIHSGATKMYKDLKEHFWWNMMKNDVAEFVSICQTYQKVKTEHKHVQLGNSNILKY